jgi:hypothetical protein
MLRFGLPEGLSGNRSLAYGPQEFDLTSGSRHRPQRLGLCLGFVRAFGDRDQLGFTLPVGKRYQNRLLVEMMGKIGEDLSDVLEAQPQKGPRRRAP